MKSILLFIIFLLITAIASASEVPEGGQISGIVKDVDNNPISDVRVELYLYDAINSIETKSSRRDGIYIFKNIEPGEYKLRFSKNRLITVWPETRPDQIKTKPIIVLPYETIQYPDVVMGIGGTVTGRVTNINGPSSNIIVLLYSSKNYDPVYQSISDSQGNYAFIGIPSGRYALRIGPASSVWPAVEQYNIIVTAPETVSGIDVELSDLDKDRP